MLKEFLSKWGKVQSLSFILDPITKKFKGYAFATLENPEQHKNAVASSSKYEIFGRKIILNYRMVRTLNDDSNESCWFCFNNPNIESHLIFSEGKYSYIALAKGPLSFHHFLIIPKKHIGSTLSLDNDTLLEIEQQVEYLIEFLQRVNEDYIMYERYIKLPHESASHMHIQMIGIPQKHSFDLFDQFDRYCHKRKIEFKEEKLSKISDLRKVMEGVNMKYFYIEFYGLKSANGNAKHHFIHFIKDDEMFPLNFGREYVCNVLGEEDKANWKNCLNEKEEEISIMKKLKDEIKGTF